MEEIINKCKDKDISAQSTLYEKYSEKVYRTAYLLTRSKTLAEDVTQETFIRLFSKITLYDEDKLFDSWLYTITLNVARSILKRQKWLNLFGPLWEYEIYSNKDSLELNYERKERDRLIKEVIDRLPYKLREVIILKYYINFSQEEIASILNIPIGTVKSRIHTSLEKVRKVMDNNISIREVFSHE